MNNSFRQILKDNNLTIEDIKSSIRKTESPQMVFVYHSRLLNLGTKHSDFDIYVISEMLPLETEEKSIAEYVTIKGVQCDVEYWLLDDIKTIIDSKELSIEEVKILQRLYVGYIINEDVKGQELKGQINNSKLFNIIIEGYSRHAVDLMDDANKFFDSREYLLSYNCIRQAIDPLIAALNAKNGYVYLKDKWTPKVFVDNKGYRKGFLERYYKYYLFPRANKKNLVQIIHETFDFAQDVYYEVDFKV